MILSFIFIQKKKGLADTNYSEAKRKLNEVIRGHLVLFPEKFLEKETLKTRLLTRITKKSGICYIQQPGLLLYESQTFLSSFDLAGHSVEWIRPCVHTVNSVEYLDPAVAIKDKRQEQEETFKMMQILHYSC